MSANRARSCFELATDAPGMLVDEDEATLGTRLFVAGQGLPRIDE